MGRRQRPLPRQRHDVRSDRLQRDAGLFTAGAQVALDHVWRLGFAGGYQSSTIDTATNAQSRWLARPRRRRAQVQSGAAAARRHAVRRRRAYDTKRPMAFGGFTGLAEGDQISGFFNRRHARRLRVRSAAPLLQAHARCEPHPPSTSAASPRAAATVRRLVDCGQGQTVFSLAPTLEAGTEWWLAGGTLVRPMLRGGRHLVRPQRSRPDGILRQCARRRRPRSPSTPRSTT